MLYQCNKELVLSLSAQAIERLVVRLEDDEDFKYSDFLTLDGPDKEIRALLTDLRSVLTHEPSVAANDDLV